MPQESINLVRATIDAINRRDAETLASIAGETFEFHSAFTATEGRVMKGSEAVRDTLSALSEALDGRVQSLRSYLDPAEALQAAGLTTSK